MTRVQRTGCYPFVLAVLMSSWTACDDSETNMPMPTGMTEAGPTAGTAAGEGSAGKPPPPPQKPDAGTCAQSERDDCGVCSGGNRDKDCAKVCFGNAKLDECGVCNGDNAAKDCKG